MSKSPNIIFARHRAYVEHPKYGWDESKCRRPTYEELETALHQIQAKLAITPPALGTQEGEAKLAEIQRRHDELEAALDALANGGSLPSYQNIEICHADRADLLQHAASHARTIEALRAAVEMLKAQIDAPTSLMWRRGDDVLLPFPNGKTRAEWEAQSRQSSIERGVHDLPSD